MANRILVVDDEPDLEDLVTRKFRRQIREGALIFLFARDGIEALTPIETDRSIDMPVGDLLLRGRKEPLRAYETGTQLALE